MPNVSSIVAQGAENLQRSIESEAREAVEERYAEQWNQSGLIQRWRLQRVMDLEIAEIVQQKLQEVSSKSLF